MERRIIHTTHVFYNLYKDIGVDRSIRFIFKTNFSPDIQTFIIYYISSLGYFKCIVYILCCWFLKYFFRFLVVGYGISYGISLCIHWTTSDRSPWGINKFCCFEFSGEICLMRMGIKYCWMLLMIEFELGKISWDAGYCQNTITHAKRKRERERQEKA